MQDQPQGGGMERRMVHRLLMHWRGAQQSDGIPSLDAILSRDLGDIETYVYVLDIRGEVPVFERIGSDMLHHGGKGLIGEPVSDAPSDTLLGQATRYYSKVMMKQIPITLGGEFIDNKGNAILYRSLIAPLSDESGESSYLLGAANCKVEEG